MKQFALLTARGVAVLAFAVYVLQAPGIAAASPERVAQMMAMEGKGTVVAVVPDREQVVIDHEPIEGMMDAMVMGFTVADPALLEGLEEGQDVTFKLRGHDMVITEIKPGS